MNEQAVLVPKFDPYLTQRLSRRTKSISVRDENSREGVDFYFVFDYMGSAEFEYGALPKAIKLMRAMQAATTFTKTPKELKVSIARFFYKIWFVGDESQAMDAVKFFENQITTNNSRLKERTGMKGEYLERFGEHDGWWMINSGCAMFIKKEDAKDWIKGLNNV